MAGGSGGRLGNRSAAITGAAGGIGLATARAFVAEGARVALIDRDDAALRAAVSALGPGSSEAVLPLQADITEPEAVEKAFARIREQFGRLEILVNNAAARAYGNLSDASAESWGAVLDVNLLAAANCVRAALPMLRRSGAGAIVNVSSAFALIGRRGMGQYDASKAALVAMTRVLAAEEAPHGVRVNAVCPGSVLTTFTLGRAAARGMSEEELTRRGMVPCLLNRWAQPEEVAYPILWLASSEASFITGAVLPVDGGLTASLA
jgi:meso-butanediol dehydrogenase/(S,S)-butanediol dehydrogenase/diacetyl reductase